MQEQWQKLKAWWSGLEAREQRAATIGAIVVFIFIVYQFMWSPLVNRQQTLRKQIAEKQTLLRWMQATDKEISRIEREGQPTARNNNPVLLLGFVQKEIKKAGLTPALKQLKQAGNDTVEMHFQRVEFDKLMAMLAGITKQQPVSIPQMSVNADVTPGIVNADVYLKLV